jgi:hypothetical protein
MDLSKMNDVIVAPDRRQNDQAAPRFHGGRQSERVETQMRWAVVHGGDQELLDLLRFESDRLFAMIAKSFPRKGGAVVIDPSGQPLSQEIGGGRQNSEDWSLRLEPDHGNYIVSSRPKCPFRALAERSQQNFASSPGAATICLS